MNNLGTRNSELETLKIIAVIPARYAASRFPGKLMQILGDKTVISTTYQNVVETGLFDEVFVATDSEIIFDEITNQISHDLLIGKRKVSMCKEIHLV